MHTCAGTKVMNITRVLNSTQQGGRWPKARITLRQAARVVHKNWDDG